MSTKKEQLRRSAARTKEILGDHVAGLVGHTLTTSQYAGHGHAEGRQGRKGHEMPQSTAHLQGGEYIPRAAFSGVPQNRQSTFSDGAGSADANDASTTDYGVADSKSQGLQLLNVFRHSPLQGLLV
jgi:hypothetical protein